MKTLIESAAAAKAAGTAVAQLTTEQKNAALLAAQILSVGDAEIAAKLDDMRREMTREVLEKDRALRERLKREDEE